MMNPTEQILYEYESYLDKLSKQILSWENSVIKCPLVFFRYEAKQKIIEMLRHNRKQINYLVTKALLIVLFQKYEEQLKAELNVK